VLAERIQALRAELHEPNGLEAINQELKNRRTGEAAVDWVRILDGSTPAAVTPAMDRLLPENAFSSSVGAKAPTDYRTGGHLFSLMAVTESVNGREYTIEVAQDRSGDEQFRKKFRALLAMSVGLGTIAFAVIGTTVTRQGLRPLREMTDSLARITPTHLSERLDPARWPRELQPLAVAFGEMLQRLESSFVRLSQFSADLAHELRTPIANLLGEAQVALTRARTADEYRSVIESSVSECERLSAIVDNLLFLARAESTDRQIQPSFFQARSAVEKIAEYYRPLAEDRRVTIDCKGEGKILADPALFDRAVNNLVENALRYTPDEGKIQILVQPENGQTTVAVHDTGCGIAPEHLPHLFDRFYRVDPARNSGGTGLGLALVKSIAELHRGSAKIESKVGNGTTVTISFPNQG
jgi:two-component system heavy metal sensor histidine kinase CusS